MMTLSMPSASAASVPGLICSHSSAREASPRADRVDHDQLGATLHHVDGPVTGEIVVGALAALQIARP
jgi:hypothetical protein